MTYQDLLCSKDMKSKSELAAIKTSIWKKEVHASFKKVVAFDLFFYGLGIITGAGIMGVILLK